MENDDKKKEQVDLSIVIPVYNEKHTINQTLTALEYNISVSYEVIIIYDFDEDTTLQAVKQNHDNNDNIRLVKNSVARGPSGALRTGFAEAKAPLLLVIMADLCDDLTQINYLVSLVPSQADIVCPSRYCKGGKQELKPSLKAFLPRLAGYFLRLISGLPTYDPTNSFKLYSANVLNDIKLKSTISFSVTLEIVAKAHCLGYRIVEVPTIWKDREFGKSNFKLYRSIIVYLPWFFMASMRGNCFRLPVSWLRAWFGF